ncbi:MAG: hypothetical protein M5U28_53070 [Sandaracinaceae bacterium]|nr:hypothetical protein [Sandaracinaceae bacterium]
MPSGLADAAPLYDRLGEANLLVAGERVAFERYLDDPEGLDFDARRSVVCWIDL